MFKYQNQPLTLSGIIQDSWELYKASLFAVIVFSFVISFCYVLPAFFGQTGGVIYFDAWHHIRFSLLGIILFFIFFFLSTYIVIILLLRMHSVAAQQRQESLKKVGFIATKEVVPVYIAMVIYYALILAGATLFLFPGILVWMLLVMFLPLMVLEGKGILEAFKQSAEMVWGRWWQTFFALLVPSLITYGTRNLIRFIPVHPFIINVLDIILMTLIIPFFYTTMLVQYNNLKIRYSTAKESATTERMQS